MDIQATSPFMIVRQEEWHAFILAGQEKSTCLTLHYNNNSRFTLNLRFITNKVEELCLLYALW